MPKSAYFFVDAVTLVTLMPWTSMSETQGYCPLVNFFALHWKLPFVPKKNKNKKVIWRVLFSVLQCMVCKVQFLILVAEYTLWHVFVGSRLWQCFCKLKFHQKWKFQFFEFFLKKVIFGGFQLPKMRKRKRVKISILDFRCVVKSIEEWLQICNLLLICSQIQLNLPRDDPHFF